MWYKCPRGSVKPTICPLLSICPEGSIAEQSIILGVIIDLAIIVMVIMAYMAYVYVRDRKRKVEDGKRKRQMLQQPQPVRVIIFKIIIEMKTIG